MRFLKRIWRRYTLLCVLVLTSLPLTAAGLAGRAGIYSDFAFSPLKEPALSLVMQGIHDGVYPWQILKGTAEEEEDAQQSATAQTTASDTAQTADTAVAADPAETAATAQQSVSGQPAAETAAGSDTAAGTETAATEAEQEEITERQEDEVPSNAIRGDTQTIPEGVCNPVMQAEDYDVVNVAFLSPDDTEYNTDTEGIFAKNGIYFLLETVDSTYFSDALFIGDSRTVGLCEYGSLKETAAFLAKESINVYNVLDKELWFTDNNGEGWDSTVEETLQDNSFGKIYVALGVNELGIGNTYMYYEKYRELLELIREYQPDALIYIQGIMHVSKEKSSSDSCRNNTVICQRNYAISTLANGRDIFYIDMNPYVCDADGNLLSDLSGDGIHLKASAYERWDRSLMENAAVLSK